MLCALTVRQIQAGTFEQFAEAFRPSDTESPLPGWMRFHMVRDTADENRVASFGFFDGTLEDLRRSQADQGYDERRAAAEKFVEDLIVDGVFEVVVSMQHE